MGNGYGDYQYNNGYGQYNNGYGQYNNGYGQYNSGYGQYNSYWGNDANYNYDDYQYDDGYGQYSSQSQLGEMQDEISTLEREVAENTQEIDGLQQAVGDYY